jgi:hypothetical protein
MLIPGVGIALKDFYWSGGHARMLALEDEYMPGCQRVFSAPGHPGFCEIRHSKRYRTGREKHDREKQSLNPASGVTLFRVSLPINPDLGAAR